MIKIYSKKKQPINRILIGFLILILITFTGYQPVYAADTTETVVLNVTYGQTNARQMLSLINDFRTGDDAWYWDSTNTSKIQCSNLGTLTYDYGLEQIAMQRAAEIALIWGHTRPNGGTFYSFTYQGVSSNGENLAAGSSTYADAFELLQETDEDYSGQGHRRSMLSSGFNAVGIGHVVYNGVHYWVQEFGVSTSSIASTTALDTSKDVSIPFSSSYVSDLTRTNDIKTFSVIKGNTINVPDGKYNLITTDVWPPNYTREITADSTWTVEDTSIATISDGVITGKAVGTTTISTTVLGKTFEVTLNVLSKECTSHTYDDGTITLEPSCMETGIKTYVCTNCGYYYTEDVAALGHDWTGDIVPEKEPTCTESGYGTRYCKRGHCYRDSFLQYYISNVTIPATGHKEVIDTLEKPATCTEDGTTKGSHCETCNETLSTATTIPKLGHTWKQTGYTWSANYTTCSVDFTCKNDSSHTMSLSATVSDSITPSTCVTKGTHLYTATLTYDGNTYTDTKTIDLPIDPDTHPEDKITATDGKAATCTEDGYSSGVICSACNQTITAESVISATGHNYTPSYNWSADGTSCKLTLTCANDSTHVVSNIDMNTALTSSIAPTCTTTGSNTYTSTYTYEGKLYTNTKTISVAALGHNYSPAYDWNTEAGTCTMTLTCTRDSSHVISGIDMSVSSEDTVPATCIATGERAYTASYTYNTVLYSTTKTIDTPVNAENHANIQIDSKVKPTCTTIGKTQGSHCEACDTIIIAQQDIPVVDHTYNASYNWADDGSSCTLNLTCQNCDNYISRIMTVGEPNQKESTCAAAGYIKYTATYTYNGISYSDIKTITLPIAEHIYKPSYNWADDYSSCELVLTCQNDNSHILKQNMDLEVFSKTLPTCTTAGYVHIKASTNDTLYTDEIDKELPPLGHDYSKKIISDETLKSAATYDSPAIYYYTCSRCGDIGTTTFTYGDAVPRPTPDVTVSYHTHIQTLGDSQGVKTNGQMAGTSGMAKRLENIWITVDGNPDLGIQYTTHCQSYGWMPWSSNGEANGTAGEAKRLEAIKIQLTGADASKYDVYYRVHAQSYGWLGWAKNGEPSGTAGYAKRLEGIQIVVVKKDSPAPGFNYAGVNASTSAYSNSPYIAKSTETIIIPGNQTLPNISYRTHVQSFGWQAWKYNGDMSGTSGMAKRLEGINIKISNCPYSGGIEYRTHIQSYGWENSWKQNGIMSGTNGQAKRLEAIQIRLTGEMANHYDVYYRVHAQSYGWLNWAKNGEEAGTAGYAKRLEGIQIILVPKGQSAPEKTYLGITSVQNAPYIKR